MEKYIFFFFSVAIIAGAVFTLTTGFLAEKLGNILAKIKIHPAVPVIGWCTVPAMLLLGYIYFSGAFDLLSTLLMAYSTALIGMLADLFFEDRIKLWGRIQPIFFSVALFCLALILAIFLELSLWKVVAIYALMWVPGALMPVDPKSMPTDLSGPIEEETNAIN